MSLRKTWRPRNFLLANTVDSALFEESCDFVARVEHAGLDGAPWNPNDLGNLGDRFVVIVDEINNFTMRRRQLVEASGQERFFLQFPGGDLRIVRVVGNGIRHSLIEAFKGATLECRCSQIPRNGEQPRGNL